MQDAQAELELGGGESARQRHSAWKKKAQLIYEEHDCVVAVRKQRDGTGELPLKNLWFDPDSHQFRNKPNHKTRNYLSDKNKIEERENGSEDEEEGDGEYIEI